MLGDISDSELDFLAQMILDGQGTYLKKHIILYQHFIKLVRGAVHKKKIHSKWTCPLRSLAPPPDAFFYYIYKFNFFFNFRNSMHFSNTKKKFLTNKGFALPLPLHFSINVRKNVSFFGQLPERI